MKRFGFGWVAFVLATLAFGYAGAMPSYEVVKVTAQPIIFVSGEGNVADGSMGQAMGEGFGKLQAFAAERGLKLAGAPLAIYHQMGEEMTSFDVALPIVAPSDDFDVGDGDIKLGSTYAGEALKAIHKGPYAKLGETYAKVMPYMDAQKLKSSGPPWEVYINDPQTTPEEELVTEIYFPLD